MNDSASIPPDPPDDLAQLRATFPGWDIEARWTLAGTGPDSRYLTARKGDVSLQAWNADDLAAQITAAVITAALKGDDES
jgi:hypothetical protein